MADQIENWMKLQVSFLPLQNLNILTKFCLGLPAYFLLGLCPINEATLKPNASPKRN